MPVDLGLILSTSPPLYAYSAFVDSQYTHFTSASFQSSDSYDHGYTVSKQNYVNSRHLQSQLCHSPSTNKEKKLKNDHVSYSSTDCTKHDRVDLLPGCKPREKKKVSFADDKGLALVEIRNIPENPNFTTRWARDFFSAFTNVIAPKNTSEKKWKIAFPNPPYNPNTITEKLEKNMVALEYVDVSEDDDNDIMTGIVRVKNVVFEKEVFVRISFDRWSTYEDISAKYDDAGCNEDEEDIKSSDAFRFTALIKPAAVRYEVVEFCVCYRVNGKEFWDNNGGINYRLVSTAAGKAYKTSTEVSQILSNNHERSPKMYTNITDRYNSCSDIETWKALFNEQPYW